MPVCDTGKSWLEKHVARATCVDKIQKRLKTIYNKLWMIENL